MNDLVTLEDVKNSLPKNLKCTVTQDLVDKLNSLQDPEICNSIRESFISYNSILLQGKYKLSDYLNAIMYVTYKSMGHTNRDSYIKTFPDRYAELVAKGTPLKDIDALVSIYSKGKLVTNLLERVHIPVWLLNQDAYQKAINTQVELMTSARSEMVRMSAADSLLKHLAKPEIKDNAINLNINTSGSQLDELKDAITQLAQQQKSLIEKGVSAKTIAEQKIIEVSLDE